MGKGMTIFKGYFEVVDGKLDFVCETQNISFLEVKKGLIALRDEIDRQLQNENKCPFHNEPEQCS